MAKRKRRRTSCKRVARLMRACIRFLDVEGG
jgi:hypothetical protein